MKDALIVQALKSNSLPIALLTTTNIIAWANPCFLEIENSQRNLKQNSSAGDLLKPLISPLSFEPLRAALDSRQAKTIFCMRSHSDKQGLSIHLGEYFGEHRMMTIFPHSTAPQLSNNNEIDVLTGLGNRIMFERILGNTFADGATSKAALIMIDLDHFKRVNDTLGHLIGDKLLKLVATRFGKLVRAEDNLIRLGGDEFVVLMSSNAELSALTSLAQRFVIAAKKTFVIQSQQINISASIGIARADATYKNSDELYRHADLALYESKQLGRSHFSVFTPELEQRAQYRRAIEIGLRRGLVKKEFRLGFIPQIAVTTNTLTGFETVLQWHSKELGLVESERFFPIAEDIGEMNKIGNWGLEQAIKQAKQWPSYYALSLSITLRQLLEDGFAPLVLILLDKYGVLASNLEIMLSEKTLMETKAHGAIRSLANAGVKIALYDPIARYESLMYLSNLPISSMRVHRDFVVNGDASADGAIRSIIDIGGRLGIPVVAQGIRNEADFCELKKHGFQDLQGFFTNSTLSVEQVEKFVVDAQRPNRECL